MANPRSFFFFNDTATTEIYTLSLHDALPIYRLWQRKRNRSSGTVDRQSALLARLADRKSTRLNSSHSQISYAAFCLKQKSRNACTNTASNGTPMVTGMLNR